MLHHYPNHGCGGAAEHGCGGATAASFSALFHVPRKLPAHEAYDAHHDAAVDCTLSLGTPSTRRGGSPAPAPAPASASAPPRRAPCAAASTLWWGVVSKRKERSQDAAAAAAVGFKESGASAGASVNLGADPLVARRCANCDTTSTPLWRNGPRGPKSLCNACGIRYKKEERRAAATTSEAAEKANAYTQPRSQQQWGCYGSTVDKDPSFSIYGSDDTMMDDGDLPYLSWRLNITRCTVHRTWVTIFPSVGNPELRSFCGYVAWV
uniref:GATA-type domain-containing protein n=1 Tax=Ananas comosus var. bracteatus TaxID=296719 RepID=A0A6V7PU49_ANACO|nr:unnamed protein product [Ananas comosus var. bracteatus]